MPGSVRNTVITKDSLKDEKKKRLTGRDDQAIHNEIFKIETSSYRGKTGLPPNPKHKVNYLNHPYGNEKEEGRRLDADSTLYRPMRVRYFTDAMLQHKTASNAEQINFVENVILPYAAEFWSKALSVVPVEGKLKMDSYDLSNRMFCGDSEFSEVPQSHIEEGVEDADLVWYVSATPSTRFCGSSTLAVAVACNFDQFDRPTAGAVNFCLDQIKIDSNGGQPSDAVKQDNVDVAVHEAAHILGMSSNAFRYFYDSDTGKPRTSRPFKTQTVTCVDGTTRTEILPSENTLKMGTDNHGQRYASIVTPRVRTVVRNHFNCQTLDGAQLENQPTEGGSCIGDHWEEKFFYPEAMTSVMSPTTNVLSPLTLALMEDSGWYVANYSHASLLPWGHGVGCKFLEEACLTFDIRETTIPKHSQGFFCNDAMMRGCSSGQTHKMACNLQDYSRGKQLAEIPLRYQYFDSETMGGLEQVDYCPVFGSTYGGLIPEQLECENDNNVDTFNVFSEYYGDGSKCFETNTGAPRCYLTQCLRDPTPYVRVNIRGSWYNCDHDFQQVTYKTNNAGILNGVLICPRLSAACPNLFCPVNCAGRGRCDYDHLINETIIQPTCKCFNTSDTSPACTESYVPKGDFFLEGPLYASFTPGFLDPLISVFLDSPQTWSNTTWGLAVGGLVLFFKMIICIIYSFCVVKNPSKVCDEEKEE